MTPLWERNLPRDYQLALKMARRSPLDGHKNGTVIARKGEVLTTGWSHVSHLVGLYGLHSLHAEIHALARGRHLDLTGVTVINACFTPAGLLTNARPCLTCAIALRSAGCTQVIYSSAHVSWGVLTLDYSLKGLKLYGARKARGG